jgi:cobalamin biosynthetic protein CobC
MLEHGGKILAAARLYGIASEEWIDLSTGINPNGWPISEVPHSAWQRLPESNDELAAAAKRYYKSDSLLSVAGVQAALQALPGLRVASRVGIITPSYAEHYRAWSQHGHRVEALQYHELSAASEVLDVIVICNPNNPTGNLLSPSELRELHKKLAARKGWLLIDESFIDAVPELSMVGSSGQKGLIVLRSLGKFFGLPGARVGFVHGTSDLLNKLEECLGPWAVNGPARWIAARALSDEPWQSQARRQLAQQSARLSGTLARSGLTVSGGTVFFQWVVDARAPQLHEFLARRGILTRLFDNPVSIRFGLPPEDKAWTRLLDGLSAYSQELSNASQCFSPATSVPSAK